MSVVDLALLWDDNTYLNVRIFPVIRRMILSATAFSIIALEPHVSTTLILGVLCFIDIFASSRTFRLGGYIETDACYICTYRRSRRETSIAVLKRELMEPDKKTRVRNDKVELAMENGYIYNYDVLEFIRFTVTRALQDVPELAFAIETCCSDLMDRLDNLSKDDHEYITIVLNNYMPSNDNKFEAEKSLVQALQSLSVMNVAQVMPKPTYIHPMRSVPLGNALQISVWVTRPSFFGATPAHTPYHLSKNCGRCN
jgi:hypothetical protein